MANHVLEPNHLAHTDSQASRQPLPDAGSAVFLKSNNKGSVHSKHAQKPTKTKNTSNLFYNLKHSATVSRATQSIVPVQPQQLVMKAVSFTHFHQQGKPTEADAITNCIDKGGKEDSSR